MSALIIYRLFLLFMITSIFFANFFKFETQDLLILKHSGNSKYSERASNDYFSSSKKYINNQTALLKPMKIDRITNFNTHDFFNASLLLWGNKELKPTLVTTHSMILFHLIYLFVKFVFIEIICNFSLFYKYKKVFLDLGLVSINPLSLKSFQFSI